MSSRVSAPKAMGRAIARGLSCVWGSLGCCWVVEEEEEFVMSMVVLVVLVVVVGRVRKMWICGPGKRVVPELNLVPFVVGRARGVVRGSARKRIAEVEFVLGGR
jgi:hypothetical protein